MDKYSEYNAYASQKLLRSLQRCDRQADLLVKIDKHMHKKMSGGSTPFEGSTPSLKQALSGIKNIKKVPGQPGTGLVGNPFETNNTAFKNAVIKHEEFLKSVFATIRDLLNKISELQSIDHSAESKAIVEAQKKLIDELSANIGQIGERAEQAIFPTNPPGLTSGPTGNLLNEGPAADIKPETMDIIRELGAEITPGQKQLINAIEKAILIKKAKARFRRDFDKLTKSEQKIIQESVSENIGSRQYIPVEALINHMREEKEEETKRLYKLVLKDDLTRQLLDKTQPFTKEEVASPPATSYNVTPEQAQIIQYFWNISQLFPKQIPKDFQLEDKTKFTFSPGFEGGSRRHKKRYSSSSSSSSRR
tara:strand:- start:1393 stop:2481 length:1089 start_codon:yes stop_codon:yes gene_type:complete